MSTVAIGSKGYLNNEDVFNLFIGPKLGDNVAYERSYNVPVPLREGRKPLNSKVCLRLYMYTNDNGFSCQIPILMKSHDNLEYEEFTSSLVDRSDFTSTPRYFGRANNYLLDYHHLEDFLIFEYIGNAQFRDFRETVLEKRLEKTSTSYAGDPHKTFLEVSKKIAEFHYFTTKQALKDKCTQELLKFTAHGYKKRHFEDLAKIISWYGKTSSHHDLVIPDHLQLLPFLKALSEKYGDKVSEMISYVAEVFSSTEKSMFNYVVKPEINTHGDLTSENIILSRQGVYLIDFASMRLGAPSLDFISLRQGHISSLFNKEFRRKFIRQYKTHFKEISKDSTLPRFNKVKNQAFNDLYLEERIASFYKDLSIAGEAITDVQKERGLHYAHLPTDKKKEKQRDFITSRIDTHVDAAIKKLGYIYNSVAATHQIQEEVVSLKNILEGVL